MDTLTNASILPDFPAIHEVLKNVPWTPGRQEGTHRHMGMAVPMPSDEETRAAAWPPAETHGHSRADDAMDRYAGGDTRAFEIVFDEIVPELERFLDSRVSAARCSEIVEHTLLAMHRMRGSFIRGSAVLPWAIAIAERLIDR